MAELILFASAGATKNLRQLVALAQRAEAACFDALLLDDLGLEPTAMLAAVATATRHIGLIAAISTTYNEPYNVARRLLSIDHISEGRAGWHLIPEGNPNEARRFGFAIDDDRVARAAEFYDVVAGLWDSWEDDALLRDKASGDYMDRDKVHFLNHAGAHFKVRGPLNITRSAQGWPVVVQSPRSDAARVLAARSADVVLIAPTTLAEAKAARAGLKAKVLVPARPTVDEMAAWFAAGAVDGFVDAPFDHAAELQRRGLLRKTYAGSTLRQHLGLAVPANRYRLTRRRG